MNWDLAKLMQERLAEINKIKKKAFLEDSDHILYLIKNVIVDYELKKARSLYIVFKSFKDLETYVNKSHPLQSTEADVDFFFIRTPDNEDDISKIKEFVSCSDGETITMMEFGGERKFFMNSGDLKVFIYGPTEIVKTHKPIVC